MTTIRGKRKKAPIPEKPVLHTGTTTGPPWSKCALCDYETSPPPESPHPLQATNTNGCIIPHTLTLMQPFIHNRCIEWAKRKGTGYVPVPPYH